VPVSSESAFTSGAPAALFGWEVPPGVLFAYDVTPDGQRFILATPIAGERRLPTVILDWPAMLPNGRSDR
jgi:hypothetical protein